MTRHELPSQFVAEPPRVLTKDERWARDEHFADAARNWESDICELAVLADLAATLACDSISSSETHVTITGGEAAHLLFCVNDLRLRTSGLKADYYDAWDAARAQSGQEPAADLLLLLGAQFEAAWRDQVAIFERLHRDVSDAASEACDAAYDKVIALANTIEAARATSLAGLIVKARAASWCHQGDTFSVETLDGGRTQDKRLAATIIRDLIALSSAPLPEIPEREESLSEAVAAAERASANHRDDALQKLGDELDDVHAARRAFDATSPDEESPQYDRHWELCKAINETEATTIAGLQVKAKAVACALRYDETWECDVAGSVRYLARSLAVDVLRLSGNDAAADAIAFLAEPPREPGE